MKIQRYVQKEKTKRENEYTAINKQLKVEPVEELNLIVIRIDELQR